MSWVAVTLTLAMAVVPMSMCAHGLGGCWTLYGAACGAGISRLCVCIDRLVLRLERATDAHEKAGTCPAWFVLWIALYRAVCVINHANLNRRTASCTSAKFSSDISQCSCQSKLLQSFPISVSSTLTIHSKIWESVILHPPSALSSCAKRPFAPLTLPQ